MSDVFSALQPEDRASVPTCEAFAARLNGNEMGKEGTVGLWAEMKAAGCVAVFGASDDLMEFRGAIHDELSAYDGTTAFVTPDGLFEPCDDDCKWSRAAQTAAVEIDALWCYDIGGPSWTYEAEFPHSTFEVFEAGEVYCRGIVFDLSEATSGVATSSPGTAEAAGASDE